MSMTATATDRPRTAVFAYSEVGSVCLEYLINDGANVAIVFTHEDDPGEEIWFRSVKRIAAENGIPVRTPAKIDAAELDALRSASPELVFSFYYRAMIPAEALKMPRLGAYNIHGALLPKYRGRACVNWAVLNGETETGATLHVMTERADRGDIIAQQAVPILFEDTAHDVFMKVVGASHDVLASSLASLEAGCARRTPQDESRATKFGRRTPDDGKIDWNKTAVEVYNLIRAVTHPFPGAFTHIDGKKVFIWKALPLPDEKQFDGAAAGGVLSTSPFLIKCGDGVLRALTIQADGETERNV